MRSISNSRSEVNSGGSYTGHVLEVITQSGMYSNLTCASEYIAEIPHYTAGFYCAHLLVLIITDAVGTNAFFIFLDPVRHRIAVCDPCSRQTTISRPTAYDHTASSDRCKFLTLSLRMRTEI